MISVATPSHILANALQLVKDYFQVFLERNMTQARLRETPYSRMIR